MLLDSELQERWEHHFCWRTQQTSSYVSKDMYICKIIGTQITVRMGGEPHWLIRYLCLKQMVLHHLPFKLSLYKLVLKYH
jgi:hypothetical protein